MIDIYILGASGAVGSKFVQFILEDKSYRKIFLISSSNIGMERIQNTYSNSGKVKCLKLDNLSSCHKELNSDYPRVFLNFAFVSNGPPWRRSINNYKLVRKVAQFSKNNLFAHYIEISSQSVFGYQLDSDKAIESRVPLFSEEYGTTKLLGELAAKNVLKRSSTSVSIVRLGNVIFQGSGPFYQRLFNIYCSKQGHNLRNGELGYINGTFLKNTLTGIDYLIKNPSNESVNIYHFSELSHLRWDSIFNLIDLEFRNLNLHPLEYPNSNIRNDRSVLVPSLKSLFGKLVHSKYSGLIFLVMGLFLPTFLDNWLMKIYRRNRMITYNKITAFDDVVMKPFYNHYRFLPTNPEGFRFEITQKDISHELGEIYSLKGFWNDK